MLDVGDRFALGGGIVLLEAIADAGSIRKAATEVGWSYRQALAYIDDAERAFGYRLVERSRGGNKRGGAHLTRRGHDLVRRCAAVYSRLVEPAPGENASMRETVIYASKSSSRTVCR